MNGAAVPGIGAAKMMGSAPLHAFPFTHGLMGIESFLSDEYQRHNKRRQEHLATLGIPLEGSTVLELGAGIGDHTSFFLDRACRVTATDAREELVEHIRARYPQVATAVVEIDAADAKLPPPHDVVYCYGLLYHLSRADLAIERMGDLARRVLLLETCVSFGEEAHLNPVGEFDDPTQAVRGKGCRPTRKWVFDRLKAAFPFAYVTATQPWHEEFPLDWQAPAPPNRNGLFRSVFVASKEPMNNERLLPSLPRFQTRA